MVQGRYSQCLLFGSFDSSAGRRRRQNHRIRSRLNLRIPIGNEAVDDQGKQAGYALGLLRRDRLVRIDRTCNPGRVRRQDVSWNRTSQSACLPAAGLSVVAEVGHVDARLTCCHNRS